MNRVAAGLIVGFAVLVTLVGWTLHPIEQADSAERDGYVEKAEAILDGAPIPDPLHPALYPVLVAGVGRVTGDVFVAARIVSHLSAVIFLIAAYVLARRLFDGRLALFCLVCLALNDHVIVNGVSASTDMTFTAFALLACLALKAWRDAPSLPKALAVSLCVALAYASRYVGITLVPAAVIFFALHGSVPARRRLCHGLVFLVATGILLIPHFLYSHHLNGAVVSDANWANVIRQLLDQTPTPGETGVFAGAVHLFLILLRFTGAGLVRLVGFFLHDAHVLAANRNYLWIPFVGTAFLAGIFAVARSAKQRDGLLVVPVVYLLGVVFMVFPTWPRMRMLLPLLPFYYMLAGRVLLAQWSSPAHAWCSWAHSRWARATAITVLLGCHCVALGYNLMAFTRNHPMAELDAGRRLEREQGTDIVIASTFLQMGNHLSARCLPLPPLRQDKEESSWDYYRKLESFVRTHRVDYVIASELTLYRRPPGLVTGDGRPAWLQPVASSPGVTILAVIP